MIGWWTIATVAILFLGVGVDVGITLAGVTRHGIEAEGNPLVKGLMRHLGIVLGLVATVLLQVVFAVVILKFGRNGVLMLGLLALVGVSHLLAGFTWVSAFR